MNTAPLRTDKTSPELDAASTLHRLRHRLGWFHGHISNDPDGGHPLLRCDTCGHLWGRGTDATKDAGRG